jgi:hypothetical protein
MDLVRIGEIRRIALTLAVFGVGFGCSSKPSEGANSAHDDGAAIEGTASDDRASLPALDPLPLGKDDLSGYAFSRGPGRAAFKQVIAAEKAGDWKAVEEGSRATLLADAGHLEAHWSLALSLARQGRFVDVAGPLSSAVAGDWMRWGERSLDDDALRGFLASDYGAQWRDLAGAYRDQFRASAARGLPVVGRRGKYWIPKKPGKQSINHRSEIYSYDVESGRYLRLSRTNASLAGFLVSPGGSQLAFVMYNRIWLPDPKAAGDARPYIRSAFVGTIDLVTATMSEHEVAFRDVASIALVYGEASDGVEPLYVRVRNTAPERGVPIEQTFLVDTAHDRKTEVGAEAAAALTGHALTVEHGFIRSSGHRVPGVLADWDDDGAAGAFRLEDTSKTITLPAGQSADATSMRWSPSRTRLVVATMAVDPCSKTGDERSVTLYVVDAAAAKLRPVAVGEGMFAPVWLDDRQLAWVDASKRYPAVRLVDVLSGSEIVRLEAAGGVSTDRLMPDTSCRPVHTDDDADELGADDDYDNPEPAPADEVGEPKATEADSVTPVAEGDPAPATPAAGGEPADAGQ